MASASVEQHDRDMALADMRLIFGHADRTMDRVYDHRTVELLRKLIMRAWSGLADPNGF